ncbi:MAG: glycosyltransferase [Burkholderiales bacterium]
MRILIVGDPRSIHTARFTLLLQELGHAVDVFAVELEIGQDEHLRGVTLHVPLAYIPAQNGNRLCGKAPWTALLCRPSIIKRVVSRVLYADAAPGKVRGVQRLVAVISSVKPHLAISLKMQNEGYAMARAHAFMHGKLPMPWIHFSWGTDMEFFGQHPDHARQHVPLIRDLLSRCDFHVADTERDLESARRLGFRGRTLGSMPANGGFDLEVLSALRNAASRRRDTVLVKGRHGGYVGRALNVVEAIRRAPEAFRPWRIRFLMASDDVAAAASALRADTGLDCEALPRLRHDEIMGCFGRAAIAVSASEVDGTPGFLLEAMAMGAFPVHSDMSSLREWIRDGENGMLFPVNDIAALAARMVRALDDPGMRERAIGLNSHLIAERADRNRLRARVGRWVEEATRSAA